ncbi:MAG TPA: hypothetical protein VK971_01890 [Thiohalobacter sp.]|nr:hypothetical protein [Thiohalobacter sp.]
MWTSKHGTGPVSPKDLMRMPAGSWCVYELSSLRVAPFMRSVGVYASRAGAKIAQEMITGWRGGCNAPAVPVMLVKVTVARAAIAKAEVEG